MAELADYYAAEESFKSADSVKRRGQEIRQENEELARTLLGDAEDYRPMPMLVMNERTPERVMRGLFGRERGEAMNRNYIYPVQQNEAEKIRFVGRMLDAVRTFQDSTGRESPLTKSEASIVQQMLEDRFVGETVASMETAQGIRNAAENIRMGKDAGDAAGSSAWERRKRSWPSGLRAGRTTRSAWPRGSGRRESQPRCGDLCQAVRPASMTPSTISSLPTDTAPSVLSRDTHRICRGRTRRIGSAPR